MLELQVGENMENNKGVASYFGGIVRVILLIVFVAIITFFVVRFFRARQAAQRAEQSTQQAAQTENQEEAQNGSGGSGEEEGAATSRSGEHSATGDREVDGQRSEDDRSIPSGIDDNHNDNHAVPNTGPESLPEAGMNGNAVLTVVMLGLSTYLLLKNRQLSSERSKL